MVRLCRVLCPEPGRTAGRGPIRGTLPLPERASAVGDLCFLRKLYGPETARLLPLVLCFLCILRFAFTFSAFSSASLRLNSHLAEFPPMSSRDLSVA